MYNWFIMLYLLISAVQQSDSVIYIYIRFLILFSIMVYHRWARLTFKRIVLYWIHAWNPTLQNCCFASLTLPISPPPGVACEPRHGRSCVPAPWSLSRRSSLLRKHFIKTWSSGKCSSNHTLDTMTEKWRFLSLLNTFQCFWLAWFEIWRFFFSKVLCPSSLFTLVVDEILHF